MTKRTKSIIVLAFVFVVALIPLSVFAATTSSGGVTLTYPDNMTTCEPTFNFSTTGVEPSWEVVYVIFKVDSGGLTQIGRGFTTGNLNVSFTPDPLVPGTSQEYLVQVGVVNTTIKLSGKWTVTCPDEPEEPDGEGCTPGFWKNHEATWPIPLETPFSAVFGGNAFPDSTMFDVVNLKGGKLNALSRHAVAAYLNTVKPIDYPLTTTEVVDLFNVAFASGDYNATKDLFDQYNNLVCPLG